MPSVNKTPTLGLNQWQGNEYFKREDLVSDNALIDAAIKQDRVTLEHKADLVNGKVPNNQLPEISSSAKDITITDSAGNFISNNVEGALAECFQYANNGKTAIRTALSNKGVTVSLEDTFTLLASKITAQMCKFSGTAVVTDVLSGKTFINNSGEILTGTMANQGAKSASLNAGGSYTIPEGYHNGNGVISANSLVNQTSGTATVGNILSGYTAWVGGIKITGTMANNGAISQSLTTQGGQYTIPAGYHNGSGKVTANISNLTAENIKKGVNVGGIVGTNEFTVQTYEKEVVLTYEQYQALPYLNQNSIYTFTGLPFTPDKVIFYVTQIQYGYIRYIAFGCYDAHSPLLGWGVNLDYSNATVEQALSHSQTYLISNAKNNGFATENNAKGVFEIIPNGCKITTVTRTQSDSTIHAKFYKYGGS